MYYIYMLASITVDLVVTVEYNLINSIYDIWRSLLLFPVIMASFVLIHAVGISALSMLAPKGKHFSKFDNFFRKVTLETIDLILHIMRVKLHINGVEKLPENERFLLVGNHLSVFDPMIDMLVFQDKSLAFVSKKENISLPFFGRLMLASGCLALDRENNRDAVKTIKQASLQISEGYCSMGIYPEGGINKTDDVLLPFHNGSFKIAKKAGAPVVVTTIRNTERLCKRFFFSSTDVYLDILRVIPSEEISSKTTAEISDMVWNEMYEHLSERYTPSGETDTEGREAAC